MPYARSLQQYTPPEFYREAPEAWERRLREVSPITSNLDHLRFRWFEPKNPDGSDRGWNWPERGQWMLYSCRPIALVDKDRALQFDKHWSELPVEFQPGRKALVSDYQHFMWHSQGVYVKPFLILQGEWGGTPAKYTPKEKAFLDASDCISEPFPLGFFPACPFDERAVKTIALRDRLLHYANDYNELEKSDRPDALKREDEAAERHRRETYMDTMRVMLEPSVEFMKSYLKTTEAQRTLPDAPAGTTDAVARWRDHFLEHGNIIGAKVASQRALQVAVV